MEIFAFCLVTAVHTDNEQGWFDSNKDVYIFRGVIDDVNQFLAVLLLLCCYYAPASIERGIVH